MGIKEALHNYPSQVETVDGMHVGRLVLAEDGSGVILGSGKWLERKLLVSEQSRRLISNYMNNNSRNLFREHIQIERGASAYFTWNPKAREVAIEWGEIVGEEAKLHHYLNQVLDPSSRDKEGMTVRSGHIAEVNPGNAIVCMLDSVWGAKKIVKTLNKNGFVVIDGLGNLQKGGELNGS